MIFIWDSLKPDFSMISFDFGSLKKWLSRKFPISSKSTEKDFSMSAFSFLSYSAAATACASSIKEIERENKQDTRQGSLERG